MRSRAAAIGMSVIVSIGSSLLTGLSCNEPTISLWSLVQFGIFLAFALIVIGVASCVNGCSGPLPRYSGGGLGWGSFGNCEEPPPRPSPEVPGEGAFFFTTSND